MARIRTIKPDFWTDSKVVSVCVEARLLFIGLLNFADDEGFLIDDPLQIAMKVFPSPSDRFDVGSLIDDLAHVGLVIRGAWHNHAVLWLPGFTEHQRINRPQKSKFAEGFVAVVRTESAKDSSGDQVDSVIDHGSFSDHSVNGHGTVSDHSQRKEGRKEGNGKEGKEVSCSEAPSACSEQKSTELIRSVPVMEFETRGNVKRWFLTEEHVQRLRDGFPDLDIVGEAMKASIWLDANPSRKKTAGGMAAFLFGWMTREQNKGGGRNGGDYGSKAISREARNASAIDRLSEANASNPL